MRPKRQGPKRIPVGFQAREDVIAAFRRLSTNNGVTLNTAFERVMIDAINAGQIPGIQRVDLDAEFTRVEETDTAVPTSEAGHFGQRRTVTDRPGAVDESKPKLKQPQADSAR